MDRMDGFLLICRRCGEYDELTQAENETEFCFPKGKFSFTHNEVDQERKVICKNCGNRVCTLPVKSSVEVSVGKNKYLNSLEEALEDIDRVLMNKPRYSSDTLFVEISSIISRALESRKDI